MNYAWLVTFVLLFIALSVMGFSSSVTDDQIIILSTVKNEAVIQEDTRHISDHASGDTWQSCSSAWLYAGSCGASSVYEKQNIHSLKAQWAQINTGGELQLWKSAQYNGCGYDLDSASAIARNSQEQYLTVLASCKELSGFRSLISSESLTQKFIDQTLNFLAETDWSGVDIDFECYHSWSEKDMADFATFLKSLTRTLIPKGYKVNVALSPKLDNDVEPTNLNYDLLAEIPVNEWEIMAYDYVYGYGVDGYAPVQDLAWARDAYTYAVSKFDSKRVVMGIPAYGYHVSCNELGEPTYFRGDDAPYLPGYSEGSYDQRSGEYTWKNKDRCYWFSDQRAMDTKRQYLEDAGVEKIAVWALGGGNAWFGKKESEMCTPPQ